MLDTTFLAAIVAAVVAVVTKLIDTYAQRRRDRGQGSVEYRKLLSEDERAFRQAVLDEVAHLREELQKRVAEVHELKPQLAIISAQKLEAERRVAVLEQELAEVRVRRRERERQRVTNNDQTG